ncbi:MAG: hypothetical protein HQK91_14930 [Nitrospirae bacterium]|nr:hypothetical protein [Nitrospirota bacterium]
MIYFNALWSMRIDCPSLFLRLKLIIILIILSFFLIISCSSHAKKPITPEKTVAQNAETVKNPDENSKNQSTINPQNSSAETITPITLQTEGGDEFISLQYKDAEITSVIAAMAERLKINYILGTNIKGKVTIQSKGKFPAKDLYQMFFMMLEMNGLTATKDGELYRIVEIDSAKLHAMQVDKGRKITTTDNGYMTQIIPIEYAKANEIASRIKPILAKGTELIVYEPSNMIIISGQTSTIAKFIKIVETLDTPMTENENVRIFVYNVENGDAKNLAGILRDVYSKNIAGDSSKSGKPSMSAQQPTSSNPASSTASSSSSSLGGDISGDVSIIPYEDINSLIIKCTSTNYLSVINTLKQLDIKTKQVLIEVLIVEVTLSDSTQFGIEWLLAERLGL